MKEIAVRGKILGRNKPSVCVPITAPDYNGMINQIDEALLYKTDLIEIRIDLWNKEELRNTERYFSLFRNQAGETPIIATYRTVNEGGKGCYKDQQLLDLYTLLLNHRDIDMVDIELSRYEINIPLLIRKKNNKKIILSYHNFERTPNQQEMNEIFHKGYVMGADIVKIAVMPLEPGDVLELLKAADESEKRINVPIIAISMGSLGKITRVFAGVFGSIITFSSLKSNSSAPGQIEMDKIYTYLNDIY